MSIKKEQLDEAVKSESIEYVVVFDKGDSTPKKMLKTTFDELYEPSASNSASNVREYVANLTQSSTNPPNATVLKNTLGGDPVWTYSGIGEYYLTLNGAFGSDASKVHILVGKSQDGNLEQVYGYWNDANTLIFDCFEQTGTNTTNGLLSNSPIYIRIFE